MSVYGGDSWAREAQYRKRRVDDLLVEGLDCSSYKKLCTGKYACLLCPQNPILDTPLMLSMHIKGSRHRAAESRMKNKERRKQEEINKRIALSDSVNPSPYSHESKFVGIPVIEQTRNATSEIIYSTTPLQSSKIESWHGINTGNITNGTSNLRETSSLPAREAVDEVLVQVHCDYQERRERELKYTAAGWKRDCHGKWFRDENVEFDSDEEDPNVCLA